MVFYRSGINTHIIFDGLYSASIGYFDKLLSMHNIKFDSSECDNEFLEKNPEIDVVAGQIVSLPKIPSAHDDIAVGLIQYNNLGNANTMYRRKSIEKFNISYDNTLIASEDWDFWLQILFHGGKFASIPEDVLMRRGNSPKYYQAAYEEQNKTIRERVAMFFLPQNSEQFYSMDGCQKLEQIASASVQILTPEYLQKLITINCR